MTTFNIQPHIAENYDRIVETTDKSYDDIADQADKEHAHELAAWARSRAANDGGNVTPNTATPAPKAQRAATIPELKKQLEDLGVSTDGLRLRDDFVTALEEKLKTVTHPAEGDYAGLDDTDLRELLEQRELDVDGDRDELIGRLQSDDMAGAAAGSAASEKAAAEQASGSKDSANS